MAGMSFDPSDPKKDRIEKLQEGLYSRGAPPVSAKNRPPLSPVSPNTQPNNWKTDEELAAELQGDTTAGRVPRHASLVSKFFFASLGFFVIAAIVAGVIFYSGFNVISPKNVDIQVGGLVAVPAGELLSLDITVQNSNNVALEDGQLLVEYPSGTRAPFDLSRDLTRDTLSVEALPAGKSVTKNIKAVLFGEKDSVKQIKITYQYTPHGSSARSAKEKIVDIAISSSPVLVTFESPTEARAGQEFTLRLTVNSNADAPVKDLIVRAEYPFGFTPIEATPKATADNNVWFIGDLEPKEKRVITIRGTLEAQDEEERTFRFVTGVVSPADERQVGLAFITSQQSVVMKRPAVSLKLRLNNTDTKEVVAAVGSTVQGSVTWTNNASVDVNDVTIQVKLTGDALDRSRVTVSDGGFYRSSDNTIVWDRNTSNALRSVAPGSSASVSFGISSISVTQALANKSRNMQIGVEAALSGTRIASEDASQTVQTSSSQTVKFATNLGLSARSVYSIGPFRNTGPIPPRADMKTTYTIVWSVSSGFNDAGGVVVSGRIPPYVTWVGAISPTGEKITYDDTSRTISWQAGEVRAGVGHTTSPREVSFQVSLQPSLTQVDTSPTLVDDIRVSAIDRFTSKNIGVTASPITTRMSTDPTFDPSDERVVR